MLVCLPTLHASESRLQEFQVENMASQMQQLAPELWDMLGLMLTANQQKMQCSRSSGGDADQLMEVAEGTGDDDIDDEYWKELEGLDVEEDEDEMEGTVPKRRDPQRMAKRREALITIVRNLVAMHVMHLTIIPRKKLL